MKKVLTLLLLVVGSVAFANTDDAPAPASENHETMGGSKKTICKALKTQETAKAAAEFKETEKKEKAHRPTATNKVCSTPERSSFGISGYFADFVHRSNVKLVNMLLD
ncbi:hypothetical protein R1T16_15925 [Flavobacterium sp. DG1-102-2]|uniref:hypothetical protein n=1 Tax=Flavobacterium sp. DG1-102-2 TaxID=3081663 RepID=UPI00294A696E|nr:hypothetical protein [Flavobacterium sp. DG1-102-2]MDV6169926.1 hypothetical protein [Flavobacterium sp. DG1-102-2]